MTMETQAIYEKAKTAFKAGKNVNITFQAVTWYTHPQATCLLLDIHPHGYLIVSHKGNDVFRIRTCELLGVEILDE